ncbi:MAG TPA: PAS domain S-box protein, partial [Rhodospirillales bacterium]|nr:PAS domain S-box protein [Rhodospirillales bacterium]
MGRIVLSVSALLLVGIAAIGSLLLWAANGRDQAAAADSRRALETGLAAAADHLASVVADYSLWDDALYNLHPSANLAWAEKTIGINFVQTHHCEIAIVFGPRNTLLYVFDETAEQLGHHARDSPSLLRLIDASRRLRSGDPAPAGYIAVEGRVFLAAAHPIVGAPPGRIRAEEASVFVFTRQIDARFTDEFGRQYPLPQLRLVPPRDEAGDGEIAIPLTAFGSDEPLGRLQWRPELPGRTLLRELTVPVATTLILMLLLLASILLDAREAGRALDRSAAALHVARRDVERRVIERTADLEAEVHERRLAEDALRTAEAQFRSIFENAAEGIFQSTPAGRWLAVNPALAQMLGFASPAELMAIAGDSLLPRPQDRAEFHRRMAEDGEVRDFITAARRTDGTRIWLSQTARAIRDADGHVLHYEGLVVDITERRDAEARLLHQALHDPLTGLPNRTLFTQRLEQALDSSGAAAAAFALLFIDCDRFKLVNDSLGHQAG